MKKSLGLITIVSTLFYMTFGIALAKGAESDDQKVLGMMHKYGITRCDKFILDNDKPKKNWNFFVSKNSGEIDKSVKVATLVQIFGKLGDTVKTEHTYIQSPNGCFLHKAATLTASRPCKDDIDGDAWYVDSAMEDKDYTAYKNKGGVTLFAKDIKVGNFDACVEEYKSENDSPLE